MTRWQHWSVDAKLPLRLLIWPCLFAWLLVSCTRQPTASPSMLVAATTPAPVQQATSDQSGALPTQALAALILPKGTPIVVRLQAPLSSAICHSGDAFAAVLDEPLVVEGETLSSPGSVVTGRVVSAKPSSSSSQPAYLRLTLSSLVIAGKSFELHTSAVFSKSMAHTPALTAAMEKASTPDAGLGDAATARKNREVRFSTGKKLKFWLVEPLPVKG